MCKGRAAAAATMARATIPLVAAMFACLFTFAARSGAETALPGQQCRVGNVELPSAWSDVDKWAWQEICEGRVADFTAHLQDEFDPTDPEDRQKWSDRRRMPSNGFLETVLLHEPFRSAVPYSGVRINGAVFGQGIDLRSGDIRRNVILTGSAFAGPVLLVGATASSIIAFNGSSFDGKLNLNSASVGGSLFLRDQAEFQEVDLAGADIAGQVEMTGSTFEGRLNMDSISVGKSLLMGNRAAFRETDLRGADIAGQVEMTGSTFRGRLNMNSISIGKSLLMGDRAAFREVDLRHADIAGQVTMSRSAFGGRLDMDSISVGKGLVMRDGAEFREVVLRGAGVAGPVDMSGSTFRGPLNMDSISVGKSLQMRDQAEFQEVRLAGADITGQVSLNGSSFAGLLDMHSMSIGRDLHMRDGAEFREVVLGGTDIAGQVTMARSTFRGTLSMDSVFVGKSLVMGEQAEFRQVVLIAAEVSDFLDARNSSFRALELAGAGIEGTLLLGSRNGTVTWASSSDGDGQPVPPRLSLRNATVGALQDGVDTWPRELQLELEGFTYDRLGGLQTGERSLPHERGSDWYIDWLSRDRFYSPQPYRQLGRILESYGHREMAADILFASRARERAESGPGEFKWWVLSALQFTIGYGYGWGYLRALCWVALFTAAGTLLIRGARNGVGDGRRPGFWYSLDMLLPVIRLNERHYDVDLSNDWRRHYFYVHKLFGYFLVSVIIAGLSGLTE